MAKQTKPRVWWLVSLRNSYFAAHTARSDALIDIGILKNIGAPTEPPIKVVEVNPVSKSVNRAKRAKEK